MTSGPSAPRLTPPDGAGAIVVGLSGGLDSTVLLHRLASNDDVRARGLRALHVHHGLQVDADAWADHCMQACAGLGIDCAVARVAVARDAGRGPEAAARDARMAAFAEALGDGEVLALAHHRDDQAETFLLRALRASGTDGLAAMRSWRAFARGWLWRPLLDTPRDAIEAYARAHGLAWRSDPSNTDHAFDRNFLRGEVLPLLRRRWPSAAAAFARSAALAADAADLLGVEDAMSLARVRGLDPRTLSRPALAALPGARRARVLRRWIASLDLPPLPAEGVHAAEAMLEARRDARMRFEWQGTTLQAWRDLLHAATTPQPWPDGWSATWDGAQPLALPDGARLALSGVGHLETVVTVRARTGGERIVLPGRDHAHAVKHVLQHLGVPPWERAVLPVLTGPAGATLALGDLAFSASFDAWLRTRGAGLRWVRD